MLGRGKVYPVNELLKPLLQDVVYRLSNLSDWNRDTGAKYLPGLLQKVSLTGTANLVITSSLRLTCSLLRVDNGV